MRPRVCGYSEAKPTHWHSVSILYNSSQHWLWVQLTSLVLRNKYFVSQQNQQNSMFAYNPYFSTNRTYSSDDVTWNKYDCLLAFCSKVLIVWLFLPAESGMLPRQKRRGGGQASNKITNAVYHKLTEVVETMAILIETQPLTDTTVLLVWITAIIQWNRY